MSDIPALIAAEAAAQGVDPAGPLGIWRAEGSGDVSALSPRGAIGPFQLMPGTASDLGVNPRDLRDNIRGGVTYYKQQLDAFKDPTLAAAAYNAGPGAVQKYGGVPPFKETQAYVQRATAPADGPTGADIFDGVTPGATQAASDPSNGADIFADGPSAPDGQPQQSKPSSITMKGGKVVFADTGLPVPPNQVNTISELYKGGIINGSDAAGSLGSPYVQRQEGDTFKPGEFYVGTEGQLHQVPTGKDTGGFAAGFGAGLGDVPNSVMKLLPGHENSDIWNAMDSHRMIYDATHQGDIGAKAGRFTGQIVGSVPLMGAAEAGAGSLAARAPSALAPVMDFLGGSAGEAMPGIAGTALRGASQTARGALEGAGAAALTSAADDAPLSDQMRNGAIAGGLLRGVVFPAASSSTAAIGGKPVSDAIANLAQTAVDKYGIPLRATQIRGAGDRKAAYLDSEMIGRPFTGYKSNQEAQRTAFTRAVAGAFGSDADKLTPDVMQAAKTRIGGVFNQVAQNTNIADTAALRQSIKQTVADAGQVLPDSDVKPVTNLANNIQSAIKKGVLSGESYQALTRKGSPLDVASNSPNSNIRQWAQQLREHLDDALEASASDEDLAALQNARWQYKNLMTVKNLAAKAGVEGEINPALLNGAVNTSFKNRAFTGAGDLGELGQIGQTFMKEPPNSGTAERAALKLGHGAGGAAGLTALGMMLLEHPETAVKTIGATAAIGSVRALRDAVQGALNRSPSVVGRLTGSRQPGLIGGAARYVVDPSLVPIGVGSLQPALSLFKGSGTVAQPQ